MYKVRFHLSKGVNYMKWQITGDASSKKPSGKPFYCDPSTVSIQMINAKLVNHVATATKIKCGANKTVCAWIECENLVIYRDDTAGGKSSINHINKVVRKTHMKLSYNPRITPNWVGHNNTNMDKAENLNIFSYGKELFYTSCSIKYNSVCEPVLI